jgi:hypothetical protein
MLNKDHLLIGIGVGIIIPALVYGIFYFGMQLAGVRVTSEISEKMQLVLMGVNALAMRYFLVTREQDQIGKGILLVTFVGVIAHFITYYSHSL